MLEKKTVIDQIEVNVASGLIGIRFGLIIEEDGNEVHRSWHRTAIEPGGDVDAQLSAVEADIAARPELRAAPIDRSNLQILKDVVRTVHSPDVVARYRLDQERKRRELLTGTPQAVGVAPPYG